MKLSSAPLRSARVIERFPSIYIYIYIPFESPSFFGGGGKREKEIDGMAKKRKPRKSFRCVRQGLNACMHGPFRAKIWG